MSAFGMGTMGSRKTSQPQKDMTVSAAYLAAEFMRKQRNSLAPDSKRNSAIMGDRKSSILPFADRRTPSVRAPPAAPPLAAVHSTGAGAGSRRGLLTMPGDKPTSPRNPELDPHPADETPSVVTRHRITIDPLGADQDNYSFASANRANPDFYVLHPKSPWLKTRTPAFPKDSQSSFKPYVSPIKHALKKKAAQSTEELLRVAADMRQARIKKQGEMDGCYSDNVSENLSDEDEYDVNSSTKAPFALPHSMDEDLRPLVKQWFADNRVYSPSTPHNLFKGSSSLVSVALSETQSGGDHGPGAPVEPGSPAHAHAHTWSTVVKAIPKYNATPTGRSTRALQGSNGLLLEDLAANHLRNKLTAGSPEEFQRLINTDIHAPTISPDASSNGGLIAGSGSQHGSGSHHGSQHGVHHAMSVSLRPFETVAPSRGGSLSKGRNASMLTASTRFAGSASAKEEEDEEDEEEEWVM
jgi:hypothetical protein